MIETADLILRKAVFQDWKGMYQNIWCHAVSAKYMVWTVTTSEEAAIARMERTIAFQATHEHHWTVVEKKSAQPIGWAGVSMLDPGVCGETGIAIGPAFVGKGYGKQLLSALTDYARDHLGASRFVACCRAENIASKRMQISCGFRFTHCEKAIDPRNQLPYILEYYEKEL